MVIYLLAKKIYFVIKCMLYKTPIDTDIKAITALGLSPGTLYLVNVETFGSFND